MNSCRTSYESGIRDAVAAACRELGYDLFIVYGRALQEPLPCSAAHNAIFSLVSREAVDGVLMVASCLAAHSGLPGVSTLAGHFSTMPVCSIGLALPGVPSVVSDNRTGMEAAIEHIITTHGCRRPLFLAGTTGNPEAQVRLEVYRQVLQRHRLPFDPALVINGRFAADPACAAMQECLERRIRFDAIVAANDTMATGALRAVRKSGGRVPRDFPVTGYDDLDFARLANPPLTTVRQPLAAMARKAVEILVAQLDGQAVPECTELPTELVVRRSCGCNSRRRVPRGSRHDGVELVGYLQHCGTELQQALIDCTTGSTDHAASDVSRLLAGLAAEHGGKEEEAFAGVVERLLEEARGDDERRRALQLALITLRRELSVVSTERLEDVFEDAAIVVALANTTGKEVDRVANDEAYYETSRRGETTSMALDLASLERLLLKVLPEQRIRTACLSRYTGPSCDELECFVCLRDGAQVRVATPRFAAEKLLPPGLGQPPRGHCSVVFPLAFEGHPLGVAVLEYDDPTAMYQVVRDQISAALRNLALHDEIVEKTAAHERSVQERLATAKRMQWLSMLAGAVAHDLNNALGPLVALPDVILDELNRLPVAPGNLEEARADIESIKTASLRAVQTIRDLLTLGRQGRLGKERLDLNRVVQGCVEPGALRPLQAERPFVTFSVELAEEPLVILASEAQLTRAITNLLRNSVEAIRERGRVTVRTRRRGAHEVIEGRGATAATGDYAVVSVADDGAGIAPADLARVFEPFFSSKHAGDQSGSGLGLAVVHSVAKEHDGFVEVRSRPGEGATFILSFPLAEGPAPEARVAGSLHPGCARILIVDDEPIQLRTGRRVLGRLGYQVDTASSGRWACELFERAPGSEPSPYDLVILDMLLDEERDGRQVFEHIQARFPAQRGIVVSGHAPTDRLKRALQQGLSWLAKPYTAEALAHAVQAALRG